MPDPHCASCHGTFVEMIENPESDPRQFVVAPPPPDHDHTHGPGFEGDGLAGPDSAFEMFQLIMNGLNAPAPQRRNTPGPTIRIDRRTGAGNAGAGTFIFSSGGVDQLPPLNSLFQGIPPASRDGASEGGAGTASGGFLRQALMGMFGIPITEGANGQWGDYALNNEALDLIMTQLMEHSTAGRPVPVPDDMVASLPRVKVPENSPLLTQQCAVCKDEFETKQETITLECMHTFHDECILPWLKSSGTCPVCRFELVPQPKHDHRPAGEPAGGEGGAGSDTASAGPASGARNTSGGSSGTRSFPGAWDDLD